MSTTTTPLLATVTAQAFGALPDGTHYFLLPGPDGKPQSVNLRLWHIRRKVRSAQFDLWPSEWNIRPDRLPEFNKHYGEYWDAREKQIPNGQIIHIPHGQDTFTMCALKEDIGTWLHCAAQFICVRRNLSDIRPECCRTN
jgi:hypothetical protein